MIFLYCFVLFFIATVNYCTVINVWTQEFVQKECLEKVAGFKSKVPCRRAAGIIFVPLTINQDKELCVVLDTGSSAFWVADRNTNFAKWIFPEGGPNEYVLLESYDRTPISKSDLRRYNFLGTLRDSFNSSTAVLQFDISYSSRVYGDWTTVGLALYKNNQVDIGSWSLKNITIARAKYLIVDEKVQAHPLGILGMRPRDNKIGDPVPNNIFLQNVQSQLPNYMFALKLNANGKFGRFTLGEPIIDQQTTIPVVIPFVKTLKDWIIRVEKIRLLIHKKWVRLKQKRIFIDTGTGSILFPEHDYKKIETFVKKKKMYDTYWRRVRPCDQIERYFGPVKLKIEVLDINEKRQTLNIGGIMHPAEQNDQECWLHIGRQHDKYADHVTLGFPLFISHYVEFYYSTVPNDFAERKLLIYKKMD